MSLLSRHKIQEPEHNTTLSPSRYGDTWIYDADQQNWYKNVKNPDYYNHEPQNRPPMHIKVYANGEKQRLWQIYERQNRPTMCAAMFWMTMITSFLVVGVISAYIAFYIPTTAETILMWLPVVSTPYLTIRYLRSHYRLDTNID